MGDTFVHVNDFQYLTNAEEPLIYFPRFPVDAVADKVAANVAFVVDEKFAGRGIALFLPEMLIQYSREQGITGICADVLYDNKPMLKVFEKLPFVVNSKLESVIYHLIINFSEEEISPASANR